MSLKMDKCILVQHLKSINSVISETFRTTQRIKLTCFDVSEDYIVFGASSGGIYIFKREPCEFLKLIPSKEGSAIKIKISANGKDMAIAGSKGLLIILEDFLDINVRPLIHNEHHGSNVTAIKWCGNTIYSGDDMGRVAVFSLTNLLTIFQTASATLMNLGTSVVQIDTYLNYLLISTKTRTVLCDTEKECFKQIGKKLRDGYFGACFLNAPNEVASSGYQSFKGIFKTITEGEPFSSGLSNSDVKIYCARPGVRLWEANFEAVVLVTQQFRDSLDQCPSDILCLEDDPSARMSVNTFKGVGRVCKNFNFGKIYPVWSRFIFTYDKDDIYFFDPKVSKLVFWSDSFKNIKQIAMLKSFIYIWQDDLQVTIISLELLEELIVKTLLNKQYYICAELCVSYYDDLINLIEYSNKIHLISILKSKLVELGARDLLEKMTPVLQTLEKFNKNQIARKKLANGIVVIENPHTEIVDYDGVYIPESVTNFDCPSSNNDKELTTNLNESVKENLDILALHKQFQLNKSHKTAELTESSAVMDKLNLDQLFILLNDFITYIESTESTDATIWCKEQFLKQASRKDFDMNTIDKNTTTFLSEAFLEICNSSRLRCTCNFPLPEAHTKRPEHYKVGCKLLNYHENFDVYLNTVPYMHKYVLSQMKDITTIVLNLPLTLQFNDLELLEQFSTLFTYDTWDDAIKLYVKLRQGKCLNCDRSIEATDLCSWSSLGMLMIKSIGPQNTTRLLKRYAQHIASGSLDATFYQCCILASTLKQPGLAVKFTSKICEENLPEFEKQMETFLQRNYLGCQNPPVKQDDLSDTMKCTYCDIPLQGPVFSDSKKCDYGHNFHGLCFNQCKGICKICSKS